MVILKTKLCALSQRSYSQEEIGPTLTNGVLISTKNPNPFCFENDYFLTSVYHAYYKRNIEEFLYYSAQLNTSLLDKSGKHLFRIMRSDCMSIECNALYEIVLIRLKKEFALKLLSKGLRFWHIDPASILDPIKVINECIRKEPVIVCGYPPNVSKDNFDMKIMDGIMTRLVTIAENSNQIVGFQSTAPIRHGFSGSPVCNSSGELIGLVDMLRCSRKENRQNQIMVPNSLIRIPLLALKDYYSGVTSNLNENVRPNLLDWIAPYAEYACSYFIHVVKLYYSIIV